MTKAGSIAAAAVVVALAASAGLHAQIRRPMATVTPAVERDARPGEPLRAAVVVSLPPGLHVQSNKPRDPAFIPPALSIDPPSGFTVTEIVYPPSTDLKQSGLDQPLAVFEQHFAIGIALTVDRSVPPGDVAVPVRLHYQACDATMCYIPTTAVTTLHVNVVAAGTATSPSHAEIFSGIPFGHGEAPAARTATAAPAAAAGPGNGVAMLDDFEILGTAGGYLGSGEFLQFVRDAQNGVKPRGMFEGRGPLAILLVVFLGGLALNLTPCVLPMIPINLAIIGAGTRAGSRRRGFLLGGLYGAAMAIVYGVLGLVVILTAGTFGTINASPWFNLGIAILFVVLGLAMFDVFAIDFSSLSARFSPKAGSRGSFLLAFTMGAIAALLAGACVAPVVIQVVLFSSNLYATGTHVALALPFVLGIGMAVPWPIAGAGIASLPKPGAWMVRVKQVLGVLILATAAYYGYLTYEILSNRWVDPSAVASSVQEKLKEGWHASLADGLAEAKRDHKPVLIDLWATWCKNCLTMDKTTMVDPAVVSALGGFVKIKYQAEQPDVSPAKDVMARFGAVGLPTYVVLRPKTTAVSAVR
jgi:thiol:disulfide interchange protein DsbD